MGDPTSVRQHSAVGFSVPMWAGDIIAMTRIVAAVEDLAERAHREALRRLDEQVAKLAASPGDEDARSRQRKRLAESMQVRMTATEKRWDRTVEGAPSVVLEQVELGEVVRVTVAAGNSYPDADEYMVRVVFKRDSGCAVEAKAPDSAWIAYVEQTLRPLLVKRRPRHWWLREQWASAVFAVVALGAIFPWLRFIPRGASQSNGTALLVIASLMPAYVIGAAVWFIVTKRFPAFELVPAGERATGARIIGWITAAALYIGSIVIPMLIDR